MQYSNIFYQCYFTCFYFQCLPPPQFPAPEDQVYLSRTPELGEAAPAEVQEVETFKFAVTPDLDLQSLTAVVTMPSGKTDTAQIQVILTCNFRNFNLFVL